MLLAQLTDLHLRVGPDDQGSIRALERAVAALGALDPAPDAILLTGDLTETGDPRAYALLRELLAPLRAPVHPIPGNHDDRDALRAAFADHPGVAASGPHIAYTAACGALRLVLCDTQEPDGDGGRMDEARLTWLAGALGASAGAGAGAPTLLAMHHPPFATGIAAFDAIGLPAGDRAAFAELLRGSPGVLRIVSGHIHRALTGAAGGVPAVVAPSAWRQLDLDLAPDAPLDLGGDPPGYALHLLTGDGLVSHAVVL